MDNPDDPALVAVVNNEKARARLAVERWYHMPVAALNRDRHAWPPKWMAFYYTKGVRGREHSIREYAPVESIEKMPRIVLFPNDVAHRRRDDLYYKVRLGPFHALTPPILSRRLRRIVFIPTTLKRLLTATEINDLWHGSPLEEAMWKALKQYRVPADREFELRVDGEWRFLDFAIRCAGGNLDVETDGDTWHHHPERAPLDNVRDNSLERYGWRLLRFSGEQVEKKMDSYCIPLVLGTINRLGGALIDDSVPRRYLLNADGTWQPGLFDGT